MPRCSTGWRRTSWRGFAEEVRAEGWAWVKAAPSATYADLQTFQRAPQEKRQPNAREVKRIAKLNAKAQAAESVRC